jgi:arginyl-tRNA--protein-N-Asp/Glu arginylyltransferase
LTELNKPNEQAIRMLTLIEPHDCSYLPNRKANSIFVDSQTPPTWDQYCQLSELGFRRSGSHFYRPQCPGCDECKSCRILVPQIDLQSKRFKRILNKAGALKTAFAPASYSHEHYDLYRKYINTRHKDGDMYPASIEQYKSFIVSSESRSLFFEIRDEQQTLVACTAVDLLNDGISAVYTYYDPAFDKLSPGTLAVLLLCKEALAKQLDYVYLGYWVKNSPKMNYKTQYKPLEIFNGHDWQLLATPEQNEPP